MPHGARCTAGLRRTPGLGGVHTFGWHRYLASYRPQSGSRCSRGAPRALARCACAGRDRPTASIASWPRLGRAHRSLVLRAEDHPGAPSSRDSSRASAGRRDHALADIRSHTRRVRGPGASRSRSAPTRGSAPASRASRSARGSTSTDPTEHPVGARERRGALPARLRHRDHAEHELLRTAPTAGHAHLHPAVRQPQAADITFAGNSTTAHATGRADRPRAPLKAGPQTGPGRRAGSPPTSAAPSAGDFRNGLLPLRRRPPVDSGIAALAEIGVPPEQVHASASSRSSAMRTNRSAPPALSEDEPAKRNDHWMKSSPSRILASRACGESTWTSSSARQSRVAISSPTRW